jgi:putative transposase
MFVVAERFLSGMLEDMANTLSTDGGTWYPQACRFLTVEYYIHSPCEKSMVECIMQYIKDKLNYFPYMKKKCKLKHMINWLNLLHFYNKG